jgi:hypothetical protein
MIEPGNRSLDRFDRRCFWRRGAAQHDDAKPERARRGNFAVSGIAAAVLRYDNVDRVRSQQGAIVGLAERPSRSNVGRVVQRQRRIHRIDAADQIMMLRRANERCKFVAAKRNKDAARFVADSDHRRGGIAYLGPAIACNGGPGRPAQRHERHAGLARGRYGIGRNDACIGMGRVDQRADALLDEIIGEARSAAKAADTNRYGMRHRRSRAAGERQRNLDAAALGETFAEQTTLRCAAENKDAVHV